MIEENMPKIVRILMEVSNICNYSCEFCPSRVSTRKKQFMDFSLFKRTLQKSCFAFRAKAISTLKTHCKVIY
ncbi:MAG: hypothetical protein V1859_03345 [archaeon]